MNGDTIVITTTIAWLLLPPLSKLFEVCFPKCWMLICWWVSTENQFVVFFGVEMLLIDLWMYTAKHMIKYYNSAKKIHILCLFDASKAFDRVNHWTLFKNFFLRNVPIIVVRMLGFCYHSLKLHVYNLEKAKFIVFYNINSVREGGILSLNCFNCYEWSFKQWYWLPYPQSMYQSFFLCADKL